MAKRLQVILRDSDYREIQRLARSRHISTAECVRQALDAARRHTRGGSAQISFRQLGCDVGRDRKRL